MNKTRKIISPTYLKLSLIDLFIQEEMRKFVEPIRKGVKRGEKIGFSRNKYLACLYASITSLNLKEISEKIHLSHIMVRTWNLEPEYKKKRVEFQQAFKNFFAIYCKSKALHYELRAVNALLYIHPDIRQEMTDIFLKYFTENIQKGETKIFEALMNSFMKAIPDQLTQIMGGFKNIDESTIKAEMRAFTQYLLGMKAYQKKVERLIKEGKKPDQ